MTSLFVDCPTGLSGDMLLAGLIDLGVPNNVIEDPLIKLGLKSAYQLNVKEKKTFGLRGLSVFVDCLEKQPPTRRWIEIQNLLKTSKLSQSIIKKSIKVFNILAEAESEVHASSLNEVHFHEIGAVDALVAVVGVCAAIEHLAPQRVFCMSPPSGWGTIETQHGRIPVPVPVVLEIGRRHNIPLRFSDEFPLGELTTPTGLALMATFADSFSYPNFYGIQRVGIGIGHRKLDRPNLLRIIEFEQVEFEKNFEDISGYSSQKVVLQETLIDDSTMEDVAAIAEKLRESGALEVVSQSVQTKKGRHAIWLQAIVLPENANKVRSVWFSQSPTLGLRERIENRWVLPRRMGWLPTTWGDVHAKQIRRPNGRISVKVEHDDLLRISNESGLALEDVRREVLDQKGHFFSDNMWSC